MEKYRKRKGLALPKQSVLSQNFKKKLVTCPIFLSIFLKAQTVQKGFFLTSESVLVGIRPRKKIP